MSRGFSLMLSAPALVVPALRITHGLAPWFFRNSKMNPQCGKTGPKNATGDRRAIC